MQSEAGGLYSHGNSSFVFLLPMIRSELNRRLGFPKFKLLWLRMLIYRKFLDWYRRSHFCQSTGSGMLTPLEAIFRHLELRGLCPSPLIVLEVFGGTGLFKTIDLVQRSEHITHIEIMEARIHHAKKLLPSDKTVFLNEDSIQVVRHGTFPRNDYNFIHIDNSPGRFGRLLREFRPIPGDCGLSGQFGESRIQCMAGRQGPASGPGLAESPKKFFTLSDTDDAARVNYETAERAYLAHIPQDRFSILEVFPVPHYGETIYMVISLMRKTPRSAEFKEEVGQAAV